MSKRIVALEPSIAAIFVALGQGAKLVAVSEHCSHLADVAHLPRTPSSWSIRAEDLASYRPDLVIASAPYRQESITALLAARLDVLCLAPESLADVYRHIDLVGRITGATDRAQKLIAAMHQEFDVIRQNLMGRLRPRVYVEMWPKPAMNAMPWVAELVELAGGEFVPLPPGRSVTDAEIQAADPQLIVLAWAGAAQINPEVVYRRPGWRELAAVRTRRVVTVDEMLLNSPGPNLVEGARRLAEVIHSFEKR
ncbi:MAG: Fe3+-hydroxamate ABC transporter substrate-binding protein [Chloroflexi bacterium]|nr:MAG: Fe3+-hydroxamate ABC transporter substrate-binding protein [Chloroflexota bacterium]